MSVIRCNNNLWLHCVSVGSEHLWLVIGENPLIQMHARYAIGGRTGWRMKDYEEEWLERDRMERKWIDGEMSRWNRRRRKRKRKRRKRRRKRTRRKRTRMRKKRRRRRRRRRGWEWGRWMDRWMVGWIGLVDAWMNG